MFHREGDCAVASHRVAGNAAAFGLGDSAIVRIDVLHKVPEDVVLPVTVHGRVCVERAAVCIPSIWGHHDHLANLTGPDHFIHQRLQTHALVTTLRPHL